MKVLCIGHSYIIPENRAVEKWIACNSDIEIGVVGPATWPGDLRKLEFEKLAEDPKYSEYSVRTMFSSRVHIFNYKMSEVRKILKKGWDGIHIWEEPFTRAAYLLGKEVKARSLPYTFLTDQNIPKVFPWPFSSWEKDFVGNSNGWAGCGLQVMDAQKKRGYPDDSSALLPHCVDTSKFMKPSPGKRLEIHGQWGLNGLVIGYVGRFVEEKGIALILEVLGKIDPKLWGGVVFLGSGPMEPAIRKWIKENGVEAKARVELVKHGDMPDVLPGVDILFSASQTRKNWKEQLGRMLIEAMACGIPNVASDSGEIPNTVGSGGLIFPENSAEDAKTALERLLKDENLRMFLGNKALLESRKFSAARVGQEMIKFWYKSFHFKR